MKLGDSSPSCRVSRSPEWLKMGRQLCSERPSSLAPGCSGFPLFTRVFTHQFYRVYIIWQALFEALGTQ